MAGTRSSNAAGEKQQKLALSDEKDGKAHVETKQNGHSGEKGEEQKDDSTENGDDGSNEDSKKRKEPSDAQDKHDDAEDNDDDDDGSSDAPSRPSKAAKKESTDGDGEESKDTSAAAASGPSSSLERKVSGQDSGSVGSEDTQWTIKERGHVYFFYRPKVQPASKDSDGPAAESIDAVQNFHMLLLPRASESSTAGQDSTTSSSSTAEQAQGKSAQSGERARVSGIGARLIRLGKKRMPEPNAALAQGDQPGGIGGDASEAIWAVISDVAADYNALKDSFAKREYTTKTSGARVVQGARLAGRGWYTLSESLTDPPSSREVRLSYVLSHPTGADSFGDVQNQLGLNHTESSCRLQMRNPTLPSTGAGAPPAGLDPSSRVEMSKEEIDSTFGGDAEKEGTRYAKPEDVHLFDRAGVELLMIKKKEQEQEDPLGVGETQQKALEKLASEEGEKLSNEDIVLKELHLDAKDNPPDALDGEWI